MKKIKEKKRKRGAAARARLGVMGGLIGLCGAGGGCESYSAERVDRGKHREGFIRRSAEDAVVGAYARALGEGGKAAGGFDPSDGLGLREAEIVALVYNRELRTARLRAGVTGAEAAHAGLWEDPVFKTDLTRILESVEEPWKVFTTVGFTIPLSGRLGVEKKRASAAHEAELTRVWASEWRVRVEVARRWVEWSALKEKEAVSKDFLERLDRIVSMVDQIAEAGEMSEVEARLFRIERATRGAELSRLVSEVKRAELGIKGVMGLSPRAGVKLNPELVAPVEGEHRGGDEAWSGSAGNVEVAVAEAEYGVAERALELEIRKQYPDLMIGPGYGREDGDDQILLGVSVPIPILNGNRQGIARARAARELAKSAWLTASEAAMTGMAEAEEELAGVRGEREAFEREIVPLVDEQDADARKIAELGKVQPLVLLETLIRQQEAKQRLIESRAAESLAELKIRELEGPEEEEEWRR